MKMESLFTYFKGKKKALIWDWNGTLLNDIDICIESMNRLLSERKLPCLDRKRYREIFTFPVQQYYEKAGFDFSKEDFKKPAIEFIDLYYNRLPEAQLFNDVETVLENLEKLGYFQTVLSAMEHKGLVMSLKAKGIYGYFNLVNGIGDHYAHSKLEVGEGLLKKLDYEKKEILLIGDSLHDLEVAETLGLDSLLISNGHQSKEKLRARTPFVIDDLKVIPELLDQAPVV
jgi:phosphoglycolate phosphatase